MPTLRESTQENDLSGYAPVAQMALAAISAPMDSLQPVLNPMIRCPLSLPSTATPDSLRQFYKGGMAPQIRFLSQQAATPVGGNSGGNATVTVFGSSTGGGSGTSSTSLSTAMTATVTSTLAPGAQYSGAIVMAKSFHLLNLSTGAACRVQMYGTRPAQLFDSARGLDVPPAPGTTQNIVFDLALDTAPYQWTFQNRAGANGDNPQAASMYITVTNLSQSAQTIAVSITYVGLEA